MSRKIMILTDSNFGNGAQEGTRTPTPLTEPAPEAGASTNFATWATGDILRYFPLDVKDKIPAFQLIYPRITKFTSLPGT